MHQHDDAAAMAFAVLRNRGYRFLAVSDRGVVVSNGSPTLAIDVSRPVASNATHSSDAPPKKKRRYRKSGNGFGYVQKATNYKNVMLNLQSGQSHVFDAVPGYPNQNLAMTLANAAHRFWGAGTFSVKTNPTGVVVIRK